MPPELSIHDRQRKARVDLAALRSDALRALDLCLDQPGRGPRPLRRLDSLDVTLLSDRVISKIHARFLGTATPTDVITFPDGDLLVSVETAARQAREHRTTLHAEILLYIIHGMLHLNGHDDHSPHARRAMHALQSAILQRCLQHPEATRRAPTLPPPKPRLQVDPS